MSPVLSGHFSSQAGKRVTRVGGFLQGLQTVPKPAQLQANAAAGREALAAASSPHQQGWPPLLGLHTSPLHLFPYGMAERVQMPWPESNIRWLSCLGRSFGPASSRCPWLGFPLTGNNPPMGNNPLTCNSLWKRGLVCGSAFPLLFLLKDNSIQLYNVVLASAKHHHESARGIPTSPSSPLFHPQVILKISYHTQWWENLFTVKDSSLQRVYQSETSPQKTHGDTLVKGLIMGKVWIALLEHK